MRIWKICHWLFSSKTLASKNKIIYLIIFIFLAKEFHIYETILSSASKEQNNKIITPSGMYYIDELIILVIKLKITVTVTVTYSSLKCLCGNKN